MSDASARQKIDLAQQVLHSAGREAATEALRLAQEALKELPPDAEKQETARVHAVLGQALVATREVAKALVHLEQGLDLIRPDAPTVLRCGLRIVLAAAYRQSGRVDDERFQLECALEEARQIGSPERQAEAARLLARTQQESGQLREATALLLATERELEGTPWEIVLTVDRLTPRYFGESIGRELVTLVRRFAEDALPRHSSVDKAIASLLVNYAQQLPRELQGRLLQTGVSERLGVLAQVRLLDAVGKREHTLPLLRQALVDVRTDEERLDVASMMLALLPSQAREETQRICEVMEPLLDGAFDHPYLRSDLAAGFLKCAQENRLLLDRAWRHAVQAAEGLVGDQKALLYNARIQALIRQRQLNPGAAASTPEQISLASWFERPLPLPQEEAASFRRETVGALLHPGPFTHPDALALAKRLLLQVPASPETRGTQARLDWVSAKCSGVKECSLSPTANRGPWDGAPTWAIALTHGRRPSLSQNVDEVIPTLQSIMQARPDRQGDCLSWLFDSIAHSPSDSSIFDTVHFLAALGSRGAIGPALQVGLERALQKTPTFPLLRLRVQLLAQTQTRGDGTVLARAIQELLAAARTPLERIEAKYFLGTERLTTWSSLSLFGRQHEMLEEAQRILLEAMGEAKTVRVPRHLQFALWVSTGNVLRHRGATHIERALELYGQADAIGAVNEFEAAKLWKVTADALVVRGRPQDGARALALIEKSLDIRRGGHLRAEALLTASRVEMMQQERGEPDQLRRAMARLEEALRLDDGPNRLGYASEIITCIARLLHHVPRDQGLLRRLAELGDMDPELAKRAERAQRGQVGPVPEALADSLVQVLNHPSGKAFLEATRLLVPLDEALLSLGMDPQELSDERRHDLDPPSLKRTPEALQSVAEELGRETRPGHRPGALTARVVLLAHLAEQGKASATEALNTAEEAEQLVRRLDIPAVRQFLLIQLAQAWAPQDTQSHPVRDFTRAARLYREVLAELKPGDPVALDARQRLARATIYRTDGPPLVHLREAEQLFEECISGYEAIGNMEGATHLRQSLAQLQSVLRRGGSEAAFQASVNISRERLDAVRAPGEGAEARAALAVALTRSGAERLGPEGDRDLANARSIFESLEWDRLPLGMRFDVENYHSICQAEAFWRGGNHEAAIRLWRERQRRIDRNVYPSRWAMTTHNLADMILRPVPGARELDAQFVREGIALCEQVLPLRPLEYQPEFHWETCDTLGRAIIWMVASLPKDVSGHGPLLKRGEEVLGSALEAARRMGGGERLGRSAFLMIQLAIANTVPARLEDVAQKAWKALDEARPYLLLDEGSGTQEAVGCIRVAMVLGQQLATAGAGPLPQGYRFLLTGASAEKVLRWMARGLGAAQRRLAGRTARPAGVPHEVWVNWLTAVRGGRPGELARAVERVQATEPLFLRGEPDLSGTWEWLRARPGSVAIAIVGGGREWQVALLRCDKEPEVQVVGLDTANLSLSEEDIAEGLSVEGSGQAYRDLLDWTRDNIVVPLNQMSQAEPSHILWIPAGPLRLLAPSDLWRTAPVTLATSLALATRSHVARPHGTLVTVADPGPGAKGEIKAAVKAGLQLASRHEGNVRLLMSRGKTFGKELRVTHPGLMNRPASPDEVLRYLPEVNVALFLGHGAVTGPLDARLVLLSPNGAIAELGLSQVGEDPLRVSGSTIILLACGSGRVGGMMHRAAGLAGAFLACGAKEVIAPLWAVRLGAAFEVGGAVLGALTLGEGLSETLHRLQVGEGQASDKSYAGRPWSLKAFVHWVG